MPRARHNCAFNARAGLVEAAGEVLKPLVQPLWERVQPTVSPVLVAILPKLQHTAAVANQLIVVTALEPWQLVLLTVAATLLAGRLLRGAARARRTWQDKGWKQVVSGFILDLPVVRGLVRREEEKVEAKIRASLLKKGSSGTALRVLPAQGLAAAEVKQRLKYREQEDVKFHEGDSHVSGGCPVRRGWGGGWGGGRAWRKG